MTLLVGEAALTARLEVASKLGPKTIAARSSLNDNVEPSVPAFARNAPVRDRMRRGAGGFCSEYMVFR
jgi:hypothetical protein